MTWLANNYGLAIGLLGHHMAIAVPAIVLAVVFSVPLGWLAHSRRRIGAPLLTALGLLYAVPSLAMFVLVPAIFGIGLRSDLNIIIVLAAYGVAVLVRTCADAFDAVPEDVTRAADACGYSLWHRFWAVDLPLALPVQVAGMRVMAVSTISLVTVGSVIGVQSLGTLFTDGFQRGITAEVLVGLVLTVLLALVVDGAIVLAGRALMPWKKVRA